MDRRVCRENLARRKSSIDIVRGGIAAPGRSAGANERGRSGYGFSKMNS